MTESQPQTMRLAHYGQEGELFAITLTNLLLKVVTLGVYHFWGKTRVRRYVWSHTAFEGERFEYRGVGLELLRGYSLAMTILIPLLVLMSYLEEIVAQNPPILALVSFTGYGVLLFLTGLAAFSSRRYLLSRTRWRSIRFGLSGSAVSHGFKTLAYSILLIFTLGFYYPFMRNRLGAHLLENTWFGNIRADYQGKGGALLLKMIPVFILSGVFSIAGLIAYFAMLPLILGWGGRLAGQWLPLLFPVGLALAVLAPILLGWFWYRAEELRYFASRTTLGPLRFRTGFSNYQYVMLRAINGIMLIFSLGLAYPWAVVRSARFAAEHFWVVGELDFDALSQSLQEVPGVGEGLAEAFDLGSI